MSIQDEHRAQAPDKLRCAVLTVSDTRTLETDLGGRAIVERLVAAGHTIVDREILPDEPDRMRPVIFGWCHDSPVDVVLITGGTGLGSRDQTCETVAGLLTKPLPGYGELFRMLSYAEIGPAAMLSRALGGLANRTVVLTMPGSPHGVELAMDRVIMPELTHLVREARR
jgi:molybdenum cofactor biosynthesis protein B